MFEAYSRMNAEELEDADEWDMIVVHDPQPVAIPGFLQTRRPHWVWRCHIDLSTPNREVLDVPVAGARGLRRGHLPHAQYVPPRPTSPTR